ncbi:mitochondrial protein [Spatholobus suberectus]|nr:mitochondrial protein [Spatholobus suberectus]
MGTHGGGNGDHGNLPHPVDGSTVPLFGAAAAGSAHERNNNHHHEEKKINVIAMATRLAARYGSRRLFSSSGSGKILSEEEKAAENAYFKGYEYCCKIRICFGVLGVQKFCMKYELSYISFGIVGYKIISVFLPNGLTFWSNSFMIWNQSLCEKPEQEKLEKLARKGPQPEAKPDAGSGGSVTDAKPSGSGHTGTSADRVSTDKYRNYAVVAGTVTILGALGWYLKGTAKKPEVQD